jgi:hypothetical protein
MVRFVVSVGLCLLGTAACSKHPEPSPSHEPDFGKGHTLKTQLTTPTSADQIFATRCVSCHGPSGQGDGPAVRALNEKPRNYADPVWQSNVTDAQIKKVIIEGGAAVGKSSLMAPNADLADNPAVLDELVKIVRGFGQPGG